MLIDSITPYLKLATYIIAPISLTFVAFNFWRKSGIRVQGSLTTWHAGSLTDMHFRHLLLENLKDRPVNILNIYIRVGNGYHIEIGSYDNAPLVLKPYEVIRIDLKKVHAYLANMKRLSFNKLIKLNRAEIFISTTTGRYKVKRHSNMDPAVSEYLHSRFMVVVQPITDEYAEETINQAKAQAPEEAEMLPKYYPLLSKLSYKAAILIFRIKRAFGCTT